MIVMKRRNGYCIIDNYKPIDKLNWKQGDYCEGWYTNRQSIKLFKIQDILMSYRELFYPRIIAKLDLPVVSNDLAKRKNQKGIISEDYTMQKKEIKNIYDMMKEYCNYFSNKPLYTVTDLKVLLQWYCLKNHLIYSKEIEQELLERFIIQILLGNSDLKPANLETYVEDSFLHFSPFYDFGLYGTIRIQDENENGYKLQYQDTPLTRNTPPASLTIENFLKNGSYKEISVLKEYLEKIKEIQFNEVFMDIKEQTKENVLEGIKRVLSLEVKNNLQAIDAIMKGNFRC